MNYSIWLLYGFIVDSVVITRQTLEMFYRKIIKQILSIPTNTADPAVYILAGAIPIESRIHILALGMYGSCHETQFDRKSCYIK
jgi:selenophosphate synthase